jgi:Ca2+-binding RTX toxin-like protein
VNLGDQTEGFDVTGFATGATTFIGGAGADTFTGGTGDDSIDAGTGADIIDAGDGTDTIVFATPLDLATAATVIGGLGNDTISIALAGAAVADSNFDDVDTVEALVFTAGGNCQAILETETQQAGIVSVFGGAGNDTFDASHAAYNTTGVYFQGYGGADSLIGGESTDMLVFTTAAELNLAATVAGGVGDDTISLTTQNQTVVDTNFTNVNLVEALTFADGTGSSAVLAGTANTAGIASVYGGSGNDSLTVDSTIYNGPTFAGAGGTDVLSLSDDNAILTNAFFADLSSVESFYTANGTNDITFGNNGLLTITGGTGADNLDASAMSTAVTLIGGLEEDTLTGGSGGSRQQGWSGTASANTYRDTLTGGSGADYFVFGDALSNAYGLDSNPATNYRALVNGFNAGATEDVFVLNALGQSGTLAVTQNLSVANRMDVNIGGMLVYRFTYDNTGQTAALFVGDSTNVVAEFNNFTSGGQNLSTSNFQILG